MFFKLNNFKFGKLSNWLIPEVLHFKQLSKYISSKLFKYLLLLFPKILKSSLSISEFDKSKIFRLITLGESVSRGITSLQILKGDRSSFFIS